MTSEDQRWRDPHADGTGTRTDTGPTRADRARSVGRGIGTGAKVTARGMAATGRVTGKVGRAVGRNARRAAGAQGAEQSGLNRLIYLHFFNTAGDAAVAISLAGSLFFQVPSGEARGQVALFLGLTMLPFAIVAPLIGPFLDKFSHGRRWAIGATQAVRAFLCWALAGGISGGTSPWLFAAALGVLVSSKAYGVTRAAAVPRLLPEGFTLVKANGRVSVSGLVGVSVSAPLAGLASLAGPEWSLRYAFLLFAVATVCAIRLPEAVDSSAGEGALAFRDETDDGRPGRRPRTRIPPAVAFALRANCGPRFLSGFLLMFMAFLLRENPPESSLSAELLIGVVVGGAGAGNAVGVALAAMLKKINPSVTVVLVLLLDAAAALLAALFYGVLFLALLGLVAGMAQTLAKFCLDSTIQRDIPERVQASAFARSDTTLQLAWVVGGFVGIAMPLEPARLGLSVAFTVLAAWTVFVLVNRVQQRPARRTPA
ncbi:MFS transporter [Nocardioides lianchengensis]|uniref:Major Facilitator Superfamily protein n=1 Tax=Nocardioides lianchengensis TaxID=1045774 RepID=A0A1G6I8G3_9ACTN|nr:MFS transporter [Nocardioides lianchengensis]NYG13132.1 MFS family permease [Nocardioides lianchengensis]SDC02740.1 Major Facilitator Superfamily protein [Nocardioides lianchengensis]